MPGCHIWILCGISSCNTSWRFLHFCHQWCLLLSSLCLWSFEDTKYYTNRWKWGRKIKGKRKINRNHLIFPIVLLEKSFGSIQRISYYPIPEKRGFQKSTDSTPMFHISCGWDGVDAGPAADGALHQGQVQLGPAHPHGVQHIQLCTHGCWTIYLLPIPC